MAGTNPTHAAGDQGQRCGRALGDYVPLTRGRKILVPRPLKNDPGGFV
jgi:hypothetical protein